MTIPTSTTPDNYRLLAINSPEHESVKPTHIFNVRDLLDGSVTKLWRVLTAYGHSAYPDYVAADYEQDALDILADAVEDTEKYGSDGLVIHQLRDSRPWLAGARVYDKDADPEREAEDSKNMYDYLGNGGYRYNLDNVSMQQVPFTINIEILPMQMI